MIDIYRANFYFQFLLKQLKQINVVIKTGIHNVQLFQTMTLPNKIILYDDVCPLCKAYTNGFVALGWLLPEHRIGFSEAPEALLNRIDLDRARHEIPLYDTESGETLYGKEALFFILGAAIPLLKPLFRWAPL
jgi:predicted DCC family thiol-disulfide oxidoreductase YuxK